MTATSGARASVTRKLTGHIAQELNDHKTLFVLFIIYLAAAKLVLMLVDGPYDGLPFSTTKTVTYLASSTPGYIAVSAAVLALWIILHDWLIPARRKYTTAFQAALAPIRPAVTSPIRTVLRAVIFTVLLGLLFSTFTQIKSIIPNISPFGWDETFWRLDRMLHGGTDPWRITWAFFDTEIATHIFDRLYISWYVMIHIVPFAVLTFETDIQRRNRYLLAFFALWVVLGNFTATMFASVGPCFAGELGAASSEIRQAYAPLLANLKAVNTVYPITALEIQGLLADSFGGVSKANLGISAMPSLHVAQAVLLCCLAWSHGRILRTLTICYAVIIQIGSVHLGWHYALDGYIATIGTLGIWWITGKLGQTKNPDISDSALAPIQNEA